jgi:hypothetical protein
LPKLSDIEAGVFLKFLEQKKITTMLQFGDGNELFNEEFFVPLAIITVT